MRTMTPAEQREAVALNVRAYRKAWRKYDENHSEIFNEVEQGRLRRALERAVAEIRSAGDGRLRALDVGSGTGNVTAHLAALGMDVTAADVSPELLRVVEQRVPGAATRRLDGLGLGEFEDETFDLVTAYSVLHHVPDYLGMAAEMVRVLRPGGVAYIDHEVSDHFWEKGGCLDAFKEALDDAARNRPGWWNPARRRWQRFLIPSKYALALKLRYRPQMIFCVEGDIHTWEFDHIEWPELERRLEAAGAEIVGAEEYLVYRSEYPHAVWAAHEDRCSDMRLVIARRSAR